MTKPIDRERLRQIVFWLAVAAVAIATRWRWSQLIADQTPFADWDSQVFHQIADLPLGPGLLFQSKPLIVPLVFRWAHNDPLTIARVQAELSFWSWALLTGSIGLIVQRRWVRLLAVVVGAAFILAPTRVGFTGSLLPESVNDSLLALSIAGALLVAQLRGTARIAAAAATAVIALAWLLTRDTNAFIAVTAAALAMGIWRGWRTRTGWGISLVAVAVAVGVLYTARVPHEPLPYQRSWYVPFTARIWYPMINNLLLRVDPDEPGVLPPDGRRLQNNTMYVVLAGPDARPFHDWILDRGSGVYSHWLLRHPITRVLEVGRHLPGLLRNSRFNCMPGHWEPSAPWSFRTVTTNLWLVLPLLIASPLLALRARRDPRCGVALCLVVSGVAGLFASYYGDTTEVSRHCYGAAQQLIAGALLGLLLGLDRLGSRRAARRSVVQIDADPRGAGRDRTEEPRAVVHGAEDVRRVAEHAE